MLGSGVLAAVLIVIGVASEVQGEVWQGVLFLSAALVLVTVEIYRHVRPTNQGHATWVLSRLWRTAGLVALGTVVLALSVAELVVSREGALWSVVGAASGVTAIAAGIINIRAIREARGNPTSDIEVDRPTE
jgi:hypothetical protein